MVSPFEKEKPPSAEQKESITYVGKATLDFDEKLEPIIKWSQGDSTVLERGDVLILKFPGKEKEILRIIIDSFNQDILRPLGISGFGKTFNVEISDLKSVTWKFDVYKLKIEK